MHRTIDQMAFADTPISPLPPAENRSRFRDLVRSLRHRNFQLFFSGQMISLIGTWMQNIKPSPCFPCAPACSMNLFSSAS
ncbi:MAG: hypothetical protein WA450_23620, partial [Candidatus Acidiferrales bacterium]